VTGLHIEYFHWLIPSACSLLSGFAVWIGLAIKIDRLKVEHEMLIDFYCEEKGIKRADLPTRHINGGL
jgi:hypothetical protein